MVSFLPCLLLPFLLHRASSTGLDLFGLLLGGFYPTEEGNVTDLCLNHTEALFNELNRTENIPEWALKSESGYQHVRSIRVYWHLALTEHFFKSLHYKGLDVDCINLNRSFLLQNHIDRGNRFTRINVEKRRVFIS